MYVDISKQINTHTLLCMYVTNVLREYFLNYHFLNLYMTKTLLPQFLCKICLSPDSLSVAVWSILFKIL